LSFREENEKIFNAIKKIQEKTRDTLLINFYFKALLSCSKILTALKNLFFLAFTCWSFLYLKVLKKPHRLGYILSEL
jgi:hypothetical protein